LLAFEQSVLYSVTVCLEKRVAVLSDQPTLSPSKTAIDALHARGWAALPERGTPAMLRLISWIALRIGRSAARLLLYPITFYFLISARAARRVSSDYLMRIRGRPARWWHVFRHFHCFAATILDRLYLLKGEFARFNVAVHQSEILHRQVETDKGCILLGSHLGSFEVLRTLGVTQQDLRLKVLMDIAHNENITRFLDALNPEIANTVIESNRPDVLLRVKESLDAGFLIGTLGDRISSDGKTAQCQFLGAPATFPAGPIVLAAVMHCPVILFFGIYRGGNRYEIYFEQLAEEIILDRDRRPEEIRHWMQRYADRLEYYTRLAPYNWFNFYPFWS
jgi:predicted LPLAT superfamily acyltransferase